MSEISFVKRLNAVGKTADRPEIPEDIREAARQCLSNWGPRGQIGLDEAIARALLAERERCAQVDDAKALEYEQEASDLRNSDIDRRMCAAIAVRLRGAATAIREQ